MVSVSIVPGVCAGERAWLQATRAKNSRVDARVKVLVGERWLFMGVGGSFTTKNAKDAKMVAKFIFTLVDFSPR